MSGEETGGDTGARRRDTEGEDGEKTETGEGPDRC